MNESFDPSKHRDTYGALESNLESVNKKISGDKTPEELESLVAEKRAALTALEAERDKAHEAGVADNAEFDANIAKIDTLKKELSELEARQSEITGPKIENEPLDSLNEKLKSLGSPATLDSSFEGGVFTIDIDPELEKALTTWETAKQAFKEADGASKSWVWDDFDTDLKDQYESLTHNTLDCVLVHHGQTTLVERKKLIEDMETAGYRPLTLAELMAIGITHPEFNKRNEYLTTLKEYSLDGLRQAPLLYWLGGERGLGANGVDGGWSGGDHFLFVRK